MLRSTAVAILAGASAVLALACGRWRDPVPCPDCSVVLVSIDTLRADHLPLYGYRRDTAPYLSELASESVVFDESVSTGGGTLPVHMSLFTSLPPLTHNVLPHNDRKLEDERITLAEQLHEAGLVTAAFTDSGWMKGKFGFDYGFDHFDDSGGRLETILPKALAWLDAHAEERFFLFVHTYDVHSQWKDLPYDCPDPYPDLYSSYDGTFDGCEAKTCASRLLLQFNEQIRNDPAFDVARHIGDKELRYLIDLYDGCINYVDAQLRRLVAALEQHGMLDRTLLVVTSDHGEEFLDHGLFLHQNFAFEELVRVPLLVRFPEAMWGGQRVAGMVTSIDLMPTILETLDIPVNSQARGVSFLPLLRGEGPVRDRTNLFNSLRTTEWKLWAGRGLWNLKRDPQERENLIDERPDVMQQLQLEATNLAQRDRALFEQFQRNVAKESKPPELSEEEREQLRALGYVQ